MNTKIVTIVAVFVLGLNLFAGKTEAKTVVSLTESLSSDNILLANAKTDPRVKKLEAFLQYYKSPLSGYSFYFVYCADKYGLDWKLLPAITGIESTFGKRIPGGSYNAYGWGNGLMRFNSWEQSIDHVSQKLAEKYIAKGLDTPYKINPVYCPPNPTWGRKVALFMEKIEFFDQDGTDKLLDNLLFEEI